MGQGTLPTCPRSPFRFQGKEWTRPDRRGHISPEFLEFRAVPVEAVVFADEKAAAESDLKRVSSYGRILLQHCQQVSDVWQPLYTRHRETVPPKPHLCGVVCATEAVGAWGAGR